MWYYWLLAIVALIVILLHIPIPFELEYQYGGNAADDANADVKKLKFKIAHITVVSGKKKNKPKKESELKKSKKSENDDSGKKKGFKAFMDAISGVKNIIKELKPDISRMLGYLKKKIDCRLLRIHLEAGFDDAAKTGIAAGAAYGTVYGAAAMIYNTVGVKDMDIQVRPNFMQSGVRLYIKSIFTISLAHIIRAVFMLLKMYRKVKRL